MSASISTRCISPRPLRSLQDRCHHVLFLRKKATLLLKSSKHATTAYNSDELALVLSDIEREYYREVRADLADYLGVAAPSDFFQLLNLDLGATPVDIKASYRALQRLVHPDLVGEAANELAVILNIAYSTLMDDNAREVYLQDAERFRKEGHSYDGRPVSKWMGADHEHRAVFVDETSCVGCRHCTYCAPNTFAMEEDYGRARVHTQWGDDEEAIREAVEMCPVDCISFVNRKQVALLEFVLKFCTREDTAIMARRRSGNMSSKSGKSDPFSRAETWLRQRKDAKIHALESSARSLLTEETAAAMARAWLALPQQVREQGWPSFEADHREQQGRVAYFQ
ncbi:probable chaperone protein dnaJ C76, chloroplastic [Coccomyxa sp. Obi]|nr:probable chaperone protein dnaJ C76, chloroplastic [Coccomyxa sp. Obi]